MDNTLLNPGVGGDAIRDIDRSGVKTQVIVLDMGGAGAENLMTAGQKTMANSIPVVMASDQIPLLQQDLIGNANNYYPAKVPNDVLGIAPVVNNTNVDIWEGPTPIYVFPTAGQQFRIVSTSANDAVGGSGVRTVWLHLLDDTGTPVNVVYNLNGLTQVLTTETNLYRVNAFHAASLGTVNGSSAGDISITNVDGTITYAIIKAGNNTAHQAIFTIPAGKTGYLCHWQGSSGSAAGSHFTRISIRATQHEGILNAGVFLSIDQQGTLNGGGSATYPIPIKFPSLCDVKMTAISDAANANVIAMGAMFGWIE